MDYKLRARHFWMQKSGMAPSHYEDSFCYDMEKGRVAIADGVAQSIYARLWAQLIVRDFVNNFPEGRHGLEPMGSAHWMSGWIERLRGIWLGSISIESLKWYQTNKIFAVGGACTFLGLRFNPERNKDGIAYDAVAVGDCCMIHVPGNSNECSHSSFPIKESREFNSVPNQISTLENVAESNDLSRIAMFTKGVLKPGERLILGTDAISEFILKSLETKNPRITKSVVDTLLEEGGPDRRKRLFVDIDLRGTDSNLMKLKNDDITIVEIIASDYDGSSIQAYCHTDDEFKDAV